MRTNYVEAKIDKTQQYSKCRLCGDKDKTINHTVVCCLRAQKEYKIKHDCVGKVIDMELCMKLKFYHSTKW